MIGAIVQPWSSQGFKIQCAGPVLTLRRGLAEGPLGHWLVNSMQTALEGAAVARRPVLTHDAEKLLTLCGSAIFSVRF